MRDGGEIGLLRHNNESESQRALPWWREALQESQTVPTQVADALLPEARDIGEELEEEARQRALLTPQEVVIPLNIAEGYRKTRRCLGFLSLLLIGGCLPSLAMLISSSSTLPKRWPHLQQPMQIMHLSHYVLLFITILLLALVFMFYRQARSAQKKGGKGSISFSPAGIHLVTPLQTLGPVPWSEITDICPYQFFNDRYIGIFPNQAKDLVKRLRNRVSHCITFSEHFHLLAMRSKGSSRSFDIEVSSLPMTEEAFMAQVHAYQTQMSRTTQS